MGEIASLALAMTREKRMGGIASLALAMTREKDGRDCFACARNDKREADGRDCFACARNDKREIVPSKRKEEKMSGKNCKKYEDLGIRYNEQLRDHYATPKQLRMIEAMWMTSPQVKKKDQEALRKFIKRILGKDHITWILKSEVQKVVKAIKSLKTKNKKKNDA